jgi:Skp family chaperone for outer membrane proteins
MNMLTKGVCTSLLLVVGAAAQSTATPTTPVSPPVAYTSLSQLNGMLSQLQQASQGMQADLGRLRIDKWKTDSSTKQQALNDVESIQRNLRFALPEMIGKLQNSPEDMAETFELYRNLDALYNVFGSLVESAGAFGPRDDFQALQDDLGRLERSRRAFADRMDSLATAKEAELVRLRAELKNALAALPPPPPPKKVIVDDTEPAKKPVAKKKVTSRKKKTSSGKTTASQPPPQ